MCHSGEALGQFLQVEFAEVQSSPASIQNMIKAVKTDHFKSKLQECSGDQDRIFRFIAHLQNTKGKYSLPEHEDILELCTNFDNFFVSKIMDIRNEMDNSTVLIQSCGTHSPSHHTAPSILFPEQRLTKWKAVSVDQMATLIKKSSNASCNNDPLPTKLLKDCLQGQLIPLICDIVN